MKRYWYLVIRKLQKFKFDIQLKVTLRDGRAFDRSTENKTSFFLGYFTENYASWPQPTITTCSFFI